MQKAAVGLVVSMGLAFAAVAVGGYFLVDGWRQELPQAPPFALTSTGYEGGRFAEPVNFTLADYRGKTVVLDFMAVACATCRIVTDEVLKPLQDDYGSRDDFAILSIDVWATDAFGRAAGENLEGLVALQQRENTTWRHALDTQGLLQSYGAFGIPFLTVIDADGRIVYQNTRIPSRSDVEDAVQSSLRGNADGARILQVSIPGLAMLAGLAAVLTPCAVGMLPGYIGNLARANPDQAGRVRKLVATGAVAAAGVVAIYAVFAVLLLVVGEPLRRRLDLAGPIVGVVMILVGVASLLGFPWNRLLPARLSNGHPGKGFFGFGVAYGAAAFGCTGPLFIPLMVAAFLDGPAMGLAAFAAYAAGVAILLIAVAYLVAMGHVAGLQRILPRASRLNTVASVLMIAAGAYLLWFYNRAGVLPWQ